MIRYPDDVSHSAVVAVDLSLYATQALFRALYQFTGDFFVYVERRTATDVDVYLTAKKGLTAPVDLAGRFANALIDEQVRCAIAEETRAIREILVAEAFAAAEILDRSDTEADYHVDPKGIAS